jgi:hypothetical protein
LVKGYAAGVGTAVAKGIGGNGCNCVRTCYQCDGMAKASPPVTVTSTPFILKTRNSATIRNRAENVEGGGFCYGTNGKG